MPYSNYQDRLERTRAYNKTPHGRAVKRAARAREYARIKAARQMNPNPAPLAQALAQWSRA